MTISKAGNRPVTSVSAPSLKPVEAPTQEPAAPQQPALGGDGFDQLPDYARQLGGPQRLADGDDGTGATGSGSGAGSAAGTTAVAAPKLSKEDQQRMKLIEHMGRDNTPPLSTAEKNDLLSAFRSLSVAEVQRADKTNVRIWRGNGTPPDLAGATPAIELGPLRSPAAYMSGARVLRIRENPPPSSSQLTHEVGHLRDDMLDDAADLKPVTAAKGEKAQAAWINATSLASESGKKLATQAPGTDGKLKPAKLSIEEMYKAYVKRSESYLHEDLFHSPQESNTYARKNAKEFFGEAFAVFHGADPKMQAKLREQAPEVYYFLKADAKANGVPVPDEKALDAAANGN